MQTDTETTRPKILVTWFSRTGTTAQVARELAQALGATAEPLRSSDLYAGRLGWLRALWRAGRGHADKAPALTVDPARFDLVVVGSPVWNNHPALPVRAFLRSQKGRIAQMGLFVTQGGFGASKALEEMTRMVDSHVVASVALRQSTVQAGRHTGPMARFAAELRAHLPQAPSVELAFQTRRDREASTTEAPTMHE